MKIELLLPIILSFNFAIGQIAIDTHALNDDSKSKIKIFNNNIINEYDTILINYSKNPFMPRVGFIYVLGFCREKQAIYKIETFSDSNNRVINSLQINKCEIPSKKLNSLIIQIRENNVFSIISDSMYEFNKYPKTSTSDCPIDFISAITKIDTHFVKTYCLTQFIKLYDNPYRTRALLIIENIEIAANYESYKKFKRRYFIRHLKRIDKNHKVEFINEIHN